ncbi:ribosome small subunit-dependent GTPase A [Deinococcus maricopensis]|uniref:Small ribosomal subunit biogenesis GTPase RsgA n=1 Tax=Deinococcus maricopensis (strain DSM 21211 / LMG 22137 / NRRL B-23946 / LB-34) TaxID=709986 RepID=E8U499_DEIML|nr:ribosome small subunit-dependent GTPase A [Deinococcus maricopensis]ADV65936.1 ribosome biogenesis GTPase RsgA [Deinococcus maricopensis DSM 21211]
MSEALTALGWDDTFAQPYDAYLDTLSADDAGVSVPARVVGVERAAYQLRTEHGPSEALLAGTLQHAPDGARVAPAIGDWVVARPIEGEDRYRIVHVLPRKTTFSRAVNAGGPRRAVSEQVIAANVDVILIVTALDEDFNPPRLGRYVTAVRASGAQPVILLNKTDLVPDVLPFLEAARAVSEDVPVHAIRADAPGGQDALRAYLRPGVTVALIGSSGVGKSTLTNALLGRDAALTGEVRAADRQGRHTTTSRTLYVVPGGGLLIDNPGLREIAVWDPNLAAFEEIEALAAQCRFRKCTHTTEPGCAVQAAVRAGRLDPDRLDAYREQQTTRRARRR